MCCILDFEALLSSGDIREIGPIFFVKVSRTFNLYITSWKIVPNIVGISVTFHSQTAFGRTQE
jgi:hypothetical protein